MENYGKLRKAPTKSAFKGILSPCLFWLAFHGKHNYGKVIRSNFAEGAKSFFFHNSVGDHIYKLYVYCLYLDVLQNITYDSYVCNSWWVISSEGPRIW